MNLHSDITVFPTLRASTNATFAKGRMMRQIWSKLYFFTLLLTTTSALPHQRRQVNGTVTDLAARPTFDEIVSNRLRQLEASHPTIFFLRSVQAEPATGAPTSGPTVLINITIQLYDLMADKFFYTSNTDRSPRRWSDLAESSDQAWGQLHSWSWHEKSLDMRQLMNYVSVDAPGTKLQMVVLEKPIIDWEQNQQLWWLCMPRDGGKIFWVGDQDGMIYEDPAPISTTISQSGGIEPSQILHPMISSNSSAGGGGVPLSNPSSPHMNGNSWSQSSSQAS